MTKAEEEGELRTALSGCARALQALELQARIAEVIKDETNINVVVIAPHVQAAILAALRPYPDARLAVADALASVEDEPVYTNGDGG
jgi:hypothetical protein